MRHLCYRVNLIFTMSGIGGFAAMHAMVETQQGLGEIGFEVTGLVKWFDIAKGHGFIKPSNGPQGDVLLHQTCVRQSGFKAAYEGAVVVCQAIQGPKGLQARKLLSLDNSTATAQPASAQRVSRSLTQPRRPAAAFASWARGRRCGFARATAPRANWRRKSPFWTFDSKATPGQPCGELFPRARHASVEIRRRVRPPLCRHCNRRRREIDARGADHRQRARAQTLHG